MIIPKPVSYTPQEGVFRLEKSTIILADSAADAEALYLSEKLSKATGFALPVTQLGQAAGPYIELRLDPALQSLGREGYRLNATPYSITISSVSAAGLFYGIQTLLQLLPPAVYGGKAGSQANWTVPCALIEDYPRFAWRGAMLDVSRHFMPKEFVLKFIDLMAMHKLNSLHLHLVDDQGWRIEIKKYPKLTQVGGLRKQTIIGHEQYPDSPDYDPAKDRYDGTPHGGFFTQEEARQIVSYAASRHINVMPEIEMPGHAQAAIASYPELGCTSEPLEVCTRWGIIENIFNPSEKTILFLQDVLAEVLEIFPSHFIHIGGDEAVKNQWKASQVCQQRIKELGLEDEDEMQSYFIRRMDEFLSARGRRLVGWDEILEGGLAPNAVVMSWRGEKGGIDAAKMGHDAVMAPGAYTYLNSYQSEDRDKEPLSNDGRTVLLDTVYHYDPIPAELPKELARHILGTQAQFWTEYIPDTKRLEYMAFPRLSALAEVAWTPKEGKDYEDFHRRLALQFERLDAAGIAYRPLD